MRAPESLRPPLWHARSERNELSPLTVAQPAAVMGGAVVVASAAPGLRYAGAARTRRSADRKRAASRPADDR
jgi:hypothetical protein